MKYCFECGTITSGDPYYCQSCGRSFDVKLCPRRHINPRFAEVCGQCGSRDLSTPQPKVSFWWKVLGFVLRVLLGILLVVGSLGLVVKLLQSPIVQGWLIVLVLLMAALWAMWIMLPEWLRKLIHWLLKRRERQDED